MYLKTHWKASRRTTVIAAIIVVLVAGLAYALLQSRVTVTGNTISTASPDLLVSADGINYSHSMPGFSFSGLIPGGYPAPSGGYYPVFLKNTGNTGLDLSVVLDGTPTNPGSANLSKFSFNFTDVADPDNKQDFVLQSLIGGGQPIGGYLEPGDSREYRFQVSAAADAEPGKTISNIDLAFVGTVHDSNDPNR